MRRFEVFFIIMLLASNLNAQNNERIISDILFDLCGRNKDTIFIDGEIGKPIFDYDSKTIEDKTGFKLPDNIISEWRKNKTSEGNEAHWNEYKLNNSYFKNYTFIGEKPFIKCIEHNQINTLLKQKRVVVYTIGKIVFDDKKENAIFRLRTNGQGVIVEESIMIKNIFEKWIIISRFDWKFE